MIRTSNSTSPIAAPDAGTTTGPAGSATAPSAATSVPTSDEARRQRIAEAVEELHQATSLLKCAGTGRLVKLGVSMTQVHVLWLLEEHGEQPMSRVAELLEISMSNATGLVDRMEERGLIERVRVPDDRRIVLVRLTPEGETALDEFQMMRHELAQRVLERFDDKQLARFRTAIADFRTVVRAEADCNPALFWADPNHDHEHDHGHDHGQPRAGTEYAKS